MHIYISGVLDGERRSPFSTGSFNTACARWRQMSIFCPHARELLGEFLEELIEEFVREFMGESMSELNVYTLKYSRGNLYVDMNSQIPAFRTENR